MGATPLEFRGALRVAGGSYPMGVLGDLRVPGRGRLSPWDSQGPWGPEGNVQTNPNITLETRNFSNALESLTVPDKPSLLSFVSGEGKVQPSIPDRPDIYQCRPRL